MMLNMTLFQMLWIKFNQVSTPYHKAAYENQKEWMMSKSWSFEVVIPISQSEIVSVQISLLKTLWETHCLYRHDKTSESKEISQPKNQNKKFLKEREVLKLRLKITEDI